MRKICLLLVCMLIVSGCALFQVPEEGLPGLEKEGLVEPVPEDELVEEPEEEPEEEVFTEEDYAEEKAPPPEMVGDVVFGEITLPDVASVVNLTGATTPATGVISVLKIVFLISFNVSVEKATT